MDYSRYNCLRVTRQDRVLTVAFNRPDSLNAINGEMHTELSEIFADIAKDGDTQAIRGTKASVNKILRDTANLVLDTSLAREKLCFFTEDHREAINAFLEKRPPRFTGR